MNKINEEILVLIAPDKIQALLGLMIGLQKN